MFDWLSGLPVPFQMMFTSFITLSITLLIYFVGKYGASIKYKKTKIKIGNTKPDEIEDEKSPHGECPHAKDVVILLNKYLDILSKKFEIKHYYSLRLQMNYAEERAAQLVGLMQKIYLKLLKEKGVVDAVSCTSFQIYRLIVNIVRVDMERRVRTAFRENRLAEMNDAEFKEYVNTKIDTMIDFATSLLNEAYFYNDVINREALYQENVKHIPEFKKVFSDVFEKARKIAIENLSELTNLDDELENLIKPYAR